MTVTTELISEGPALALAALLDIEPPDLEADGLPPLWHWVYLLDHPATADLGPDGHALTGGVVTPPGVGRRRMFAGGRLRVDGPLRVNEPATRSSRVVSTEDKTGRTGLLTFVTVAHEISQRDQVVVVDEQDLVYRDATPAPLVIGEPAPDVELIDGEREVPIDPALLFRFSALTYNGHRIHYDRDYARDIEGYPGLVVHGPLQAILMAESARGRGSGTGTFEYRLVSPLFDHQGLVVSATRVRDRRGRVTATGKLAGFGRP